MKTPKEYFKIKIEKVIVQVSLLSCALVIASCLIIYLVTSGIMVSILADAYDERANLTLDTIESHLDNRLYQDDIPEVAYSAVISYLDAVKENMAISEIFIVKRDAEGNFKYILDTNNDKSSDDIREETVTGKIAKKIDTVYVLNYAGSGGFYSVSDSYRYMNFYPVSDDGKNVKGIIGIGIDAGYVRTARIIMNILVGILILLCCLISVRFSNAIFKKISNPLYQDASNTDNLTGLKNKNSFSVDLHNIEANNTDRYSVVTIDLNGLKNINDTRGHQAGDMFIQRAAKIMRGAMEGTDFIAYRIGGDEFSIIGKDKSMDEIKSFVEKINANIDEENKGRGMPITMSIGYAKFDKDKDRNFSMTIERSDAMMYENKRLYYKMKNQTPR
ncbi:MAG: GGDEF domain-containing protein [Firmicutes bacterium]|nr:GGDEF domain-containing protein [Bacillota bacterium]